MDGIEAYVNGFFDAMALAPCPRRGIVGERGMEAPAMELALGRLEVVAQLHEAEGERASASPLIGIAMRMELAAQPQLVLDL